MAYLFFSLGLFCALLSWVAEKEVWEKLYYVTKPGTIIALLLFTGSMGGYKGGLFWFTIGLVFSLVGDVILMLPKANFLAGLVAFLFTQGAYVIGFNATLFPLNLTSFFLAVLIGICVAQVYRRLSATLVASGYNNLRLPVLIYTVIISLMLFSAMITLVRPDWDYRSAFLVSSGALLFFLSDLLLAWNRFVSAIPNSNLIVVMVYHLGQFGIIGGAINHFLA